jgi:hypothetical protein
MAAQTGRTHSKFCTVKLDNASGTLTDLSAYVNSVGSVGLTFDTQDVTAFSDAVKNVVVGQPAGAITLGGPVDTTIITHMAAICGTGLPLSMDIQLGIRQAYTAGEPQFGISMSATSGYLCTAFTVDPAANTWQASFDVFGAVAPAWGTSAEA